MWIGVSGDPASLMFFRSQISVGSLENLNIRATGDHSPKGLLESPTLPDLREPLPDFCCREDPAPVMVNSQSPLPTATELHHLFLHHHNHLHSLFFLECPVSKVWRSSSGGKIGRGHTRVKLTDISCNRVVSVIKHTRHQITNVLQIENLWQRGSTGREAAAPRLAGDHLWGKPRGGGDLWTWILPIHRNILRLGLVRVNRYSFQE